jgi:hypothetical protein
MIPLLWAVTPRSEYNYSRPICAEVKNVGHYDFTPPHAITACTETNLLTEFISITHLAPVLGPSCLAEKVGANKTE